MKGVIIFPYSCTLYKNLKVMQETCILELIMNDFECLLSFTIRISVGMFENIALGALMKTKTDGGSCMHLK